MIAATLEARRVVNNIRQAIQELTLVSHAPSQSFDPAPPEDDAPARWRTSSTSGPVPHLGHHHGKTGDTTIPRGGIDWKGDRTPEYRQKSADHFVRRLKRLHDDPRRTHDVDELQPLLKDAREALEAWRKTPLVAGERPALADPRWKYWAANCDHTTADLVRWYGITRQYLHQVRRGYREEAA